jgi:hypothetical protein
MHALRSKRMIIPYNRSIFGLRCRSTFAVAASLHLAGAHHAPRFEEPKPARRARHTSAARYLCTNGHHWAHQMQRDCIQIFVPMRHDFSRCSADQGIDTGRLSCRRHVAEIGTCQVLRAHLRCLAPSRNEGIPPQRRVLGMGYSKVDTASFVY